MGKDNAAGGSPEAPLSGYDANDILHQGPHVVVRRARRVGDGLPVVLKALRPERATPREVARLRHEQAIAKEIAHPGVVRILGVEERDGAPVLVLEDFGATSLDVVLRDGALDLPTTLRIGTRVAGTLAALHRAGVIHKDIKPHNVLVRLDPLEVKLTDFGIATRLSHEVPRAENPDVAEGTLAYMSPEQTGWMNRSLDCRTDLYSLGVTLYQMLTGALPFSASSAMELVHCHLARAPAPPLSVSPHVPCVLSDIVMKLLSKAAEDRYQRAEALQADLEECLRRYEADGRIEPFPLAARDAGGALSIPEKLYGREAETEALVAACGRAAAGATEMLLVAGHAGVGKSALVHEVYKALAHQRGDFVAGKFGQLAQRAPYAAIAQAFGELCDHVQSERAERLSAWRARIAAALGSNGQVVVNVVPELARILGPQPPLQPLGPNESQNRFNLAFQSFVRAVTQEQLLVVFIDDLQWADPASLKLLELLLTEPEGRGLLVIGAYRDDEVDDDHPLARLLNDLRAVNAPVHELRLRPLALADVRRLVADTFHCGLERAEPFAELVLQKTAGNPFFITQYLRALADEGIARFDPAAGAWTWDIERARRATGESVIELMAAKIRRLAPDTQRMLKLAACVGHAFDIQTLALAGERPPAEVAAALWDAMQDGLLVPLGADYRFVHSGGATIDGELLDAPSLRVSYRFLHDRIQQAAYSLLDGAERQRLHRRIGRLLSASAARSLDAAAEGAGPPPADEELFRIVDHLNAGAALIEDAAERRDFVRWNLAAGRRARAATAFDAAFGYLSAAAAALDPELSGRERSLAFEVHAERAEGAYLSGRYEEAEALLAAVLEGAASDLERARVHGLRATLCVAQGRFREAVAEGRRGLRLFDAELPGDAAALEAALHAELAEVSRSLGDRRIEDIGAGPELTDPDKLAVLKLLACLETPAYLLDPLLYQLVVTRMASLSLRSGNSELSSWAYVTYGFMTAAFRGRVREGYEIARAGVTLHDRYNVDELKAKTWFLFAATMMLSSPHREALDAYQRALDAAMETGDIQFARFASNHIAVIKLSLADDLLGVREEVEKFLRFARRTRDVVATAMQAVARQVIENLTGRTFGRGTLSDASFDEQAFAPTLDAPGLATPACWYYTTKLALAFLYGDHEGALAMALRAHEKLAGGVGQYFAIADLPLYTCLTITALGPRASREESEKLAEMLASSHDKLVAIARDCPEFRHMDLLVAAERARVAGEETDRVLDAYDQAIDAAQRTGYVRYSALAHELCGRFLAARGRERLAQPFLVEAHDAYARWGAVAKTRQMQETHARLLSRATGRRAPATSVLSDLTSVASSTITGARRTALLDAAAVIRSAQAIAREIDLERVVVRLVRLAVESSGAQRGALILERGEGLRVEAVAEDGAEVRVGPPAFVRESGAVAPSVIDIVTRTRGSVLVADAAQDARLGGDGYVAARRPRSVLGLPMVSQGRLTGILYLENNAAPDIFSPARLDLLELIASQAAVALENALLYGRVQATSDLIRRDKDALEAAVAERTAELAAAKTRLEEELAERARVEEARAELQDDLIRMQRGRLAEMACPLIPITDRIMAMPLIGTIDAERANQALETALRGVSDAGAQVVILDITGVSVVDSAVAATLLRTATALRLLGAEVVITGVRPQVSRALVSLDIDLGVLVIHSTLQRGIGYALQRTGEAPRLAELAAQGRRPLRDAPR
ncbi:AAA family ATPase [Sorangium sp. So ce260]|uniref:AAA family ATPase n=1 Tax=Sorangium sp. So ce260 TaxID=3133291 RepID=UPI003F632DE6